jgi:hypothetical protein
VKLCRLRGCGGDIFAGGFQVAIIKCCDSDLCKSPISPSFIAKLSRERFDLVPIGAGGMIVNFLIDVCFYDQAK